jgi:hypothetical protein
MAYLDDNTNSYPATSATVNFEGYPVLNLTPAIQATDTQTLETPANFWGMVEPAGPMAGSPSSVGISNDYGEHHDHCLVDPMTMFNPWHSDLMAQYIQYSTENSFAQQPNAGLHWQKYKVHRQPVGLAGWDKPLATEAPATTPGPSGRKNLFSLTPSKNRMLTP